MLYFRLVAIIPTSTQPRLFLMHTCRKGVCCYEPTGMAGSGLLEESPTLRYTCTERETWCGNEQTEPRACGSVNRQTGIELRNYGGYAIDHDFVNTGWLFV